MVSTIAINVATQVNMPPAYKWDSNPVPCGGTSDSTTDLNLIIVVAFDMSVINTLLLLTGKSV
jgi:hypothetical protein